MRNIVIGKGNKVPESSGDIWPMTWVGDVTYSVCNDSSGCPSFLFDTEYASGSRRYSPGKQSPMSRSRNMIFTVFRGTPNNCQVYTVNPFSQMGAWGEYFNGGSWKSAGLIFIDGVFYLSLFKHRYPNDTNRYPWWTATEPHIITSDDYGATWSKVPPEPMFDDRFSNFSFVQFGNDRENTPDGYVYAVSAAEKQWINNSTCLLGRVRREHVAEPSKWEFYAGGNPPAWGPLSGAAPIVEKSKSIGCTPEVVYHTGIGRYLLLTSSAPYLTERLPDWEAAEKAHPRQTLFHIFTASNLWGPWENIYNGEGTGGCDYCPRVPLMWSRYWEKNRIWLVSGGNPWGVLQAGDHYGLVISQLSWDD